MSTSNPLALGIARQGALYLEANFWGVLTFSYIMTLSLHVTTWLTFCTTRCLWSACRFRCIHPKNQPGMFDVFLFLMECTPTFGCLCFGGEIWEISFFFHVAKGSEVEKNDPREYRRQGLLLAVDLYKV